MTKTGPRRLEVGVVFHEAPHKGELVQRLGRGTVTPAGTNLKIPVLVTMPQDRKSLYITVEGCKYRVLMSELVGAVTAEHVKETRFRPDPEAGDARPRILGIPFLPKPPEVDEERKRWLQRN